MKKPRREHIEPLVNQRVADKYGFQVEIPASQERYVSPNQAARILNVTGEAVKQWIYRRQLPAVKLNNGYWKIKVKDLEEHFKLRQNVGQKRILVIAQDDSLADVIVSAIRAGGYEPISAHNFSDALLKAADLLPSIFIIHQTHPENDVWQFIKRVRAHRNLRRLSILLIAEEELSEVECGQAMDLEIQGVLKQPVTTKMIQDEIGIILTRIL